MMITILKNTTSDTRENTRFLADEPKSHSRTFYTVRVSTYIYNVSLNDVHPYHLEDEELTKMSMELSQSSLNEVWDNEEDDFWDNIQI